MTTPTTAPACRRFLGVSLSLIAVVGFSAEVAKRKFEIPAGEAEQSLKTLSVQSGRQILFPTDAVEGIRTKPVRGEITAADALRRMLAGTPLVGVEDEKTGALTVRRDPAAAAAASDGSSAAKTAPGNQSPATIKKKVTQTSNSEPMKRPSFFRRITAALAVLAATAPAEAQISPVGSAPSEETIELSPFVVSAAKDTGYAASQTLAGTRIASNVDDIAAQVTVMTPQFLDDVGASTLEEALLYSLNVENLQDYANAQDDDALAGVEQATSEHGNQGQRVRGLASADSTSDFFRSEFNIDSYNSERFTFNSGPNAILFGLGSLGGLIDQSQKRARFTDSNQVSLRLDSYDGYRGTLDVNRVLMPGVLALRGSFLYSNAEGWRKPSRTLDRRQFLTATYRPFAKTTLRVSYENVRTKSAIARNQIIKDGVTPYLAWRTEEMARLGITDPMDPRLYYAPNGLLDPGEAPNFSGRSGGTVGVSGGNDMIIRMGAVDPSTPDQAIIQRRGYLDLHGLSRLPHQVAGVSTPDNFSHSLTDFSIFPNDVNPGGLGTQNDQEGATLKVFAEQQITRDFNLELAYQKQTSSRIFTDWIRGNDNVLLMDVDRYVPDADDPRGYSLNPNRGSMYLESWSRGSLRDTDSDDARLTASYAYDFTGKSGWARWLGRHDFVGLFDYSDSVVRAQNQRSYVYDDLSPGNPAGFNDPNNRNSRRMRPRVYLSDAQPYYDAGAGAGILDQFGAALRPDDLNMGVHANGFVRHADNLGNMLAVQSRFWDDRIITTYGRRHDRHREISRTTPTVGSVLPPVPAGETTPWYYANSVDVMAVDVPGFGDPDVQNTFEEMSGNRDSRGIVVKPLSWLSLHYNEANNGAAGTSGYNPLGGLHEPSSGEGRDYGFGLKLFGGRMSIKVNQYENTQTGVSSSSFSRVKLRVRSIEDQALDIDARLKAGDPANGIAPRDVGYKGPTTWDPETFTQTPVLSDIESEGLEISTIANLTPNWRLRLDAAKTEVVESNIGREWFQYVAMREPEWSKLDDQYVDPDDSTPETLRELIDQEVYFEQLTLASLVDGRPSLQVRKWRVNLVTSYDFTTGFLRGWGVGGAMRWRDKGVIGLPNLQDDAGNVVKDPETGLPLPDITRPYYDDGLVDFDGWFSYSRKIGDKVRAKFQLNVRNIFDDEKLIATRTDSSGTARRFTLQSPRQFIFTTTFDF